METDMEETQATTTRTTDTQPSLSCEPLATLTTTMLRSIDPLTGELLVVNTSLSLPGENLLLSSFLTSGFFRRIGPTLSRSPSPSHTSKNMKLARILSHSSTFNIY